MSASWNGAVAEVEADSLPGRYYVTARDERGRMAYLLGPFVQATYGKQAHCRALAAVRDARRYVVDNVRDGVWFTFGTARLSLFGDAPAGKLNEVLERGTR